MKRRYILLLSALVLFTSTVIITGCPASVKPQIKKYKVTLKSGGHGSVTVKPALPADGMVEAYTQLSFTAQPDEEYEVDTWTGAYYNYPDNTTAWLTVSTDTTVSVTFKRIGYTSEKQKYKVTLVQPEHGTVTVKPALSEDGMIPQYTNLTFTVTPDSGWKVHKWTGWEIWQDQIGYNEVGLWVTKDVIVSVTMIEEGKADTAFLLIDSTGRLTGVTHKDKLKGSLVLPETVTAIGREALFNCTGLTSVIIPDSVTSIGHNAFYGCTGLTGVTIGNNVTEIDEGAFSGCSNLMSITIPDSVARIGDRAFYDCKSLTSVTIGKGVTNIGTSEFSGCNKIETLNINCKRVPCLGMTSLKELTLGDNVNEIGERAFNGCTDLTNVTIPNSVTKIESRAFKGCTGLIGITIGSGVTKIGNEAFKGCTGLTDVIISDSVVEIGKHAFEACSNIINLTIGKGFNTSNYSESMPFLECENVKTLSINCKTIPPLNGPYNITRLKELIIGDNVSAIAPEFFAYIAEYDNRSLTSITVDPLNTVYCSMDNILYTKNKTKIIYVAHELTGSIAIPDSVTEIDGTFFDQKGLTNITIGKGIAFINDRLFSGCTGLTSITIPDNVTKIGRYAFSGCTGLTGITIPASITEIGDGCFSDCSNIEKLTVNSRVAPSFSNHKNLREVYIGDTTIAIGPMTFTGCNSLANLVIGSSVTKIGFNAFDGCSSLTDVIIPDSVTDIENEAFANCSNLTNLTIGSGVTKIGSNAFDSCSSLTDVIIPDSVTKIESGAFKGCTGLIGITIGSGVTKINDNTFSNCTGLTEVTIPDSVTEIGKSAFKNCSNITGLTIGKGLTTIQLEDDDPHKTPFDGCNKIEKLSINCNPIPKLGFLRTSLKELHIGDNVMSIGDKFFSGYTGLKSLTIGDNVTEISYMAFKGCSALKTVSIGNGVTQILKEAFFGCTELASITIPERVGKIGKNAFGSCPNLKHAVFIGTNSWTLYYQAYEYEYNTIYPSSLENPGNAAIYLANTYCEYYWKKN